MENVVAILDSAGRVVIPASARRRLGLRTGSKLTVVVDDISVRLVSRAAGAKLVDKQGRLVAVPSRIVGSRGRSKPPDFGALVEEERNRWPW